MPDLVDHVSRAMRKPHRVFTGRASTALYLYLRSGGVEGRSVALPVNICYSLVQPVRMTGNVPVFFDVDPGDANPRLAAIEALHPRPFAVVVPHMYGNPCVEMPAIADWCRSHGVALIEDCAAGFHGAIGDRPLGSFGDCTLLSFGQGKTVDASCGGLLAASTPLDEAQRINDALPVYSAELAARTELYSALFRTVYHSGNLAELAEPLGAFNPYFEDIYRYRLDGEGVERVLATYAAFDVEADRRSRLVAVYDAELPFDDRLARYPLAAGCVPWRFNVLIRDVELRGRVIRTLVGAGIRVGAWYPPIHGLFGGAGSFPGAESFAASVVNLPLDGTEENAADVARRVRDVTRGEGER